MTQTLTDHIADVGNPDGTVQVTVEYEIVRLLSEQLYASPLKSIEELVVNSWDADATECRVYHAANVAKNPPEMFAAVFDNGSGMTARQLEALWVVGSSPKRRDATDAARARKWIGKFGIGKLASYAVAEHATYLTRGSDGVIRALTVHFADFEKRRAGQKDAR